MEMYVLGGHSKVRLSMTEQEYFLYIFLVFVQYILRVWSHFIQITDLCGSHIFKTFITASRSPNLLVPFWLLN